MYKNHPSNFKIGLILQEISACMQFEYLSPGSHQILKLVLFFGKYLHYTQFEYSIPVLSGVPPS